MSQAKQAVRRGEPWQVCLTVPLVPQVVLRLALVAQLPAQLQRVPQKQWPQVQPALPQQARAGQPEKEWADARLLLPPLLSPNALLRH